MKTDRPLDGQVLANVLEQLANVSLIAFSLKHDLSPLTPEDIQAGAEPLDQGAIQSDLDLIQSKLAELALVTLKATREEWYAANDGIQ